MEYPSGPPAYEWGGETFRIDLHTVRDKNRVVALSGFDRPQRLPKPGENATVVDEDDNAYHAVVEELRPDGRVYLRVTWSSRMPAVEPMSRPYDGPPVFAQQTDSQATTGS